MKNAIITAASFFFFMVFFIIALVLGAMATPDATAADILHIILSFGGMFFSFAILMYQLAYVE